MSAPFPAVLAVWRVASAQALVAFRGNRYSVPPELARAQVTVTHRLGAPHIELASGSGPTAGIVIARHRLAPAGAGATVGDTDTSTLWNAPPCPRSPPLSRTGASSASHPARPPKLPQRLCAPAAPTHQHRPRPTRRPVRQSARSAPRWWSTSPATPPQPREGTPYLAIEQRLAGIDELVARLAERLLPQADQLTSEINGLTTELTTRVQVLAPTLLAVPGCGVLTAAKILGETAGIDRFTSKDAFARHKGTAPLPVWSSNRARHRLSRTGNRQLNAALHRMALTQAHWHPDAKALIARRKAAGDGGMEALRVLKRRLSDVVYRALLADARETVTTAAA